MKPETAISNNIIVKEVIINAPASKVWSALTEKEHLQNWFMSSEDYELQTGKTFHMVGKGEDCSHLHTSRILEIIAPKKLTYTWAVEGIKGETIVTYELKENNGTTQLTVTHSGWDSVTIENPSLSQEEHEKGWEAMLSDVLKNYIEKI